MAGKVRDKTNFMNVCVMCLHALGVPSSHTVAVTKSCEVPPPSPHAYSMKRKHDKMYYCSLCEYATKFQSYLSRHMHVHSNTRAYTCSSCGSAFKTHSAYLLHMRERHGGCRYTCQICAAEFAQQRTLDRHMLCHKDEKQFACNECGAHLQAQAGLGMPCCGDAWHSKAPQKAT